MPQILEGRWTVLDSTDNEPTSALERDEPNGDIPSVPVRFVRTRKYLQNKPFGEFLQRERKKRRLNQLEVAERLEAVMGVTISNTRIQRYESGARFCDYTTALKLSEAMGIPEYEMVAAWVAAYGDMQGMGAEGQFILTAYATLSPDSKLKFLELIESLQEMPRDARLGVLKMLTAFQHSVSPHLSLTVRERTTETP